MEELTAEKVPAGGGRVRRPVAGGPDTLRLVNELLARMGDERPGSER